MNDPRYDKLLESGWRRPLTAGEAAELRAWLAAHPELQPDWETEAELNQVLEHLPEAPVSTNFTARVLQAAEREAAVSRQPRSRWKGMWLSLLPKAAVAGVVLGLGLISYERHLTMQRAELARTLAVVSDLTTVPDPELLKDFETIRHLDQKTGPDEELLALLK
jgi:ferric-dicitrate binding protein FerR (iron transport regulator)